MRATFRARQADRASADPPFKSPGATPGVSLGSPIILLFYGFSARRFGQAWARAVRRFLTPVLIVRRPTRRAIKRMLPSGYVIVSSRLFETTPSGRHGRAT